MESGSGVSSNYTMLVNTTDGFSIDAAEIVLTRIPSAIQLVLCGLVLNVFYRLPSIRTEINYPIINLVASDILRAILGFMSLAFYDTEYNNFSIYARVYCVIFRYMNNVQLAWSGWAIAIIAYSRYDKVTNVFSPKFTQKRFWTLTLTSWVVSLFTSLPPIVGWSSYSTRNTTNVYNRCVTGSTEKNLRSVAFLPLFYSVNYLLPSILAMVLFSCIVCVVSSRQLKANSSSENTNVIVLADFAQPSLESTTCTQDRLREAATHLRDLVLSKSFLYISIIVVTNVLLMAPYVVTTSYDTVSRNLGQRKQIPFVVSQITTILFMVNYIVNSLLYIFWIKTFQQATGALCCRKERRSAASV